MFRAGISTARASARRTAATPSRHTTAHLSTAPPPHPWFVDDHSHSHRPGAPHLPNSLTSPRSLPLPPLPDSLPPTSPIQPLHVVLSSSPLLEPGTLLVTKPPPTPAHPLPPTPPRGAKRRRGGTISGEGVVLNGTAMSDGGALFEDAGIWSWLVLAQVKEGTEKRGAIENVMMLVRATLKRLDPPVALPPTSFKSRKSMQRTDGWAMLDAGDFAVHVLSRQARERYFGDRSKW